MLGTDVPSVPSRPAPPSVTPEEITRRFHPHPVDEKQGRRIALVRAEFERIASTIVSVVPHGRELSLVLTKLEEAAFYAVAAIAREPASPSNLERESQR